MILEVVVTESGEVCDARIVKGLMSTRPHLFDEPIRSSVLASRFAPSQLTGKPVAVAFFFSVQLARGDELRTASGKTRSRPPSLFSGITSIITVAVSGPDSPGHSGRRTPARRIS